MTTMSRICVLDAGGQYCHLIARKIRDMGVDAEVKPVATPVSELTDAIGIIVSGGPHSVLTDARPSVDKGIYALGVPILGICYGHQLIARDLEGGLVESGTSTEYGSAELWLLDSAPLFEGTPSRQRVWMSH